MLRRRGSINHDDELLEIISRLQNILLHISDVNIQVQLNENQENVDPLGVTNSSLSEQFFRACVINDRPRINEILRRRQDRKVTPRGNDNFQSPLHFAVLSQNHQNVMAVLAHGRHIILSQRELRYGYTALALACSIRTMPIEIIEDILDAKPSVASIPDNRLRKPLDILCEYSRYDLFRCFAERVKMSLSELSNRPQIALELIRDPRSFNYIFSYECHRSWLAEIYSHIFGYDFELFNESARSLINSLSRTTRHFCFIPFETAVKNCMKRNPEVAESLSKKIFMFLYYLRSRQEFTNRRYYFSGFLRTWQPLEPSHRDILVKAFIPYIEDSYSVGNDAIYREMKDYLPFSMHRRADLLNPISLARLAKDVVRKEIGKRYNISQSIPAIYQSLRKQLPKRVACFILHVPNPDWLNEYEEV